MVISKGDVEPASEDEEELIGLLVSMPHMIAERVRDPHVVVVHRGHNPRTIDIVKRAECLVEVDYFADRHGFILAYPDGYGLYIVDVDEPLPDRCRVHAWRPNIEGISEVFHARIVDYGYPPHCHDTWTVLIVDTGAISYDLDKRRCGAFGQTVAILPPGVTHNGRPAPGAAGFTKRVLYLDESFLPRSLIGAAVDQTTIDDPRLRGALAAFHRELPLRVDPLSAETSLALIADRLTNHLTARPPSPTRPEADVARQLRTLLDESTTTSITLTEAASQFGRSKAHLIRSFKASYGLTPYAYLIGRRVEIARNLLLDGIPASEAAVLSGFYDQPHLTRHFKRHLSVPPSEFAAKVPKP